VGIGLSNFEMDEESTAPLLPEQPEAADEQQRWI
jgi:hypothetical protein